MKVHVLKIVVNSFPPLIWILHSAWMSINVSRLTFHIKLQVIRQHGKIWLLSYKTLIKSNLIQFWWKLAFFDEIYCINEDGKVTKGSIRTVGMMIWKWFHVRKPLVSFTWRGALSWFSIHDQVILWMQFF